MQSRIGWLQSLALTAAAWGFFYFLFQWLLNLQFEAGADSNLDGLVKLLSETKPVVL